MIENDHRVPRKRLDARTRIADGMVTVGVQRQIIELEGSAGFIWRQIDGRRSLRGVVQTVVDHYGVDAATAEDAVAATVDPLLEAGLLHFASVQPAGKPPR